MSLQASGFDDRADRGRRWAVLGAAFSFIVAGLLAALGAYSIERDRRQQSEIQARQMASAVAHDLGERLDRSLSASNALIAVLRQGGGQIDDFSTLAKELINLFGGITALQLAPGGTISRVEPLPGNERVIGFSPLKDPIQGPETRLVIESRRLGLTGPFELRQGGVGVIGRNPVFLKGKDGEETFWGLVQVLIRVPDLLVATPLNSLEEAGYQYELWRIPPGAKQRQVFARSSDQPLLDPVEVKIPVPNGEWVLSVGPERGWYGRGSLLLDAAASLLIASLVALAAYLSLRQPQLLRHEVALRTRELQASEEKYRELVDSAASILLKWDNHGTVLFLNEYGQNFFGFHGDEIIGRSVVGTIVPPFESDGRDLSELMADIFQRPEAYAINLNENIKKNGERVWVSWHNRVVRNAAGQPIGMFSVGVDVTERRQAEIALQAANQRYEQLNAELEARVVERTRQLESEIQERRATEKVLARNERMAALGSLVAGVAHEINTPIGNALMVATTARQHIKDFEAALAAGPLSRSRLDAFVVSMRDSGAMLERNLHRAADLIHNFKQVAVDQTSDRRRSFDLATTLEEIRMTLEPLFKYLPYRLELAAEAGLTMDSYPGGLGQIVVNLVENALQHAFVGQADGCIRIGARSLADGQVEIRFVDDGVGIPPEILPRIFDPFFTTRLGQGGSGLGLSIVLNLAQRLLGGELTVDSEVGRGTAFTLTLPRQAPIQES